MRRLHAIVGALTLVVLPLVSRVFGDGFFAWTMYSTTGEYRVEVQVHDARGWRSVAPTGLADHASSSVASLLVSAETYRRGPSVAVLRAHLGELATFVCRERGGDRAVVVLQERRGQNERSTREEAQCP